MVDFDSLQVQIHKTAVEKGWWNEKRTVGDIIALIHSELSEALEEYRHGHDIREVYYNDTTTPRGFPIELADTIIRILDYCGEEDIDINAALLTKVAYNTTRPYRHGGKII